jgi:hypothetical protein
MFVYKEALTRCRSIEAVELRFAAVAEFEAVLITRVQMDLVA